MSAAPTSTVARRSVPAFRTARPSWPARPGRGPLTKYSVPGSVGPFDIAHSPSIFTPSGPGSSVAMATGGAVGGGADTIGPAVPGRGPGSQAAAPRIVATAARPVATAARTACVLRATASPVHRWSTIRPHPDTAAHLRGQGVTRRQYREIVGRHRLGIL